MHEKEFPIELPISNQIILMQGAVAGLKRVKNKTKKTPKTPPKPQNNPGSAHTGCVGKYSEILVGP